MNAFCKQCLAHSCDSGTHDDDFFNFCQGCLDVHCLLLYLEEFPQLTGLVEATLAEGSDLSTDGEESRSSSCVVASATTRKRGKCEMAAATEKMSAVQVQQMNGCNQFAERAVASTMWKALLMEWKGTKQQLRLARLDKSKAPAGSGRGH